MSNKLIAIFCAIMFVIMAGMFSFIGQYIPDHMTIGKFMTVSFFAIYEIMCFVAIIYFWLKK